MTRASYPSSRGGGRSISSTLKNSFRGTLSSLNGKLGRIETGVVQAEEGLVSLMSYFRDSIEEVLSKVPFTIRNEEIYERFCLGLSKDLPSDLSEIEHNYVITNILFYIQKKNLDDLLGTTLSYDVSRGGKYPVTLRRFQDEDLQSMYDLFLEIWGFFTDLPDRNAQRCGKVLEYTTLRLTSIWLEIIEVIEKKITYLPILQKQLVEMRDSRFAHSVYLDEGKIFQALVKIYGNVMTIFREEFTGDEFPIAKIYFESVQFQEDYMDLLRTIFSLSDDGVREFRTFLEHPKAAKIQQFLQSKKTKRDYINMLGGSVYRISRKSDLLDLVIRNLISGFNGIAVTLQGSNINELVLGKEVNEIVSSLGIAGARTFVYNPSQKGGGMHDLSAVLREFLGTTQASSGNTGRYYIPLEEDSSVKKKSVPKKKSLRLKEKQKMRASIDDNLRGFLEKNDLRMADLYEILQRDGGKNEKEADGEKDERIEAFLKEIVVHFEFRSLEDIRDYACGYMKKLSASSIKPLPKQLSSSEKGRASGKIREYFESLGDEEVRTRDVFNVLYGRKKFITLLSIVAVEVNESFHSDRFSGREILEFETLVREFLQDYLVEIARKEILICFRIDLFKSTIAKEFESELLYKDLLDMVKDEEFKEQYILPKLHQYIKNFLERDHEESRVLLLPVFEEEVLSSLRSKCVMEEKEVALSKENLESSIQPDDVKLSDAEISSLSTWVDTHWQDILGFSSPAQIIDWEQAIRSSRDCIGNLYKAAAEFLGRSSVGNDLEKKVAYQILNIIKELKEE